VKQELFTLSEILSSLSVFSGVRVTQSLVLSVCFVDRCLSFCPFSFWPLCCLSFFNLQILITRLVSSNFFSNKFTSLQLTLLCFYGLTLHDISWMNTSSEIIQCYIVNGTNIQLDVHSF
jgi:apolipoprotein N-acyltransferase